MAYGLGCDVAVVEQQGNAGGLHGRHLLKAHDLDRLCDTLLKLWGESAIQGQMQERAGEGEVSLNGGGCCQEVQCDAISEKDGAMSGICVYVCVCVCMGVCLGFCRPLERAQTTERDKTKAERKSEDTKNERKRKRHTHTHIEAEREEILKRNQSAHFKTAGQRLWKKIGEERVEKREGDTKRERERERKRHTHIYTHKQMEEERLNCSYSAHSQTAPQRLSKKRRAKREKRREERINIWSRALPSLSLSLRFVSPSPLLRVKKTTVCEIIREP